MAEPTALQIPQANPFNQQAVKEYIFNETGNIMLSSTAIGSEQISQDVRDVFAEVAVFFAALTKSISTTINPATKAFYSVYDYAALQSVIDGSGLFVQVTEEDLTHESSSFGAEMSQELVQGLLGLATGAGELSFAQAMVASMGQAAAAAVSSSSTSSDSKVANIVFICEYLLGMPIVSAIVVYVDTTENTQVIKLGPCLKEQSTSFKITMHKDTYMFVTPKFIKQYASDLLSIEDDLVFAEFVSYLSDLVLHKPIVTAVETADGTTAPSTLEVGTTYFVTGAFLDGPTPSAAADGTITPNTPTAYLLDASGEKVASPKPVATINSSYATFSIPDSVPTPSGIGFFTDADATSPYLNLGRTFTTTAPTPPEPAPAPPKHASDDQQESDDGGAQS